MTFEDQSAKNKRRDDMHWFVAPKIKGTGPSCYGDKNKHDSENVTCLDCPYEFQCISYITLEKNNHLKEWVDDYEKKRLKIKEQNDEFERSYRKNTE